MTFLLRLFCELCNRYCLFDLVEETALEEVYHYPECGREKRYTVR
jgi:hypothetical protein